MTRARAGGAWRLEAGEVDELAGLLSLHDAQLGSCRAGCYERAWARIYESASTCASPLADGRILPRDDPAFFTIMPDSG